MQYLPILVFVVFLAAHPCHACTCIAGTPLAEDVEKADRIFVATASSSPLDRLVGWLSVWRDTMLRGESKRTIRFHVSETLRGPHTKSVAVRTGWGDADCGYPFIPGRQYVVWSHRHTQTGELMTSICTRTTEYSPGSAELQVLRELRRVQPLP